MNAAEFLAEIAFACAAALAGGFIARKLKQPVVLGYLLAGTIVGPYTPGYVANTRTINTIAEWGVVFLLFAVGTEFSFRSLIELRRVGIVGGLLQVGLSILIGFAVGRAFGFNPAESVLLGIVIAMSSTMVVLKMLDERGENDSYHGRTMLAILITQDLLVVVFAAMIPALANLSAGQLPLLLGRILLAVLYLGLAVVLAVKVLPWLLGLVAAAKSRELFILAVVTISFGAAIGTERLGFSLALGAFVAGLIVSETEFSHLILAEIKPFRDFFAAVFFVSIGMLAQPQILVQSPWMIIALVLTVIAGKFLTISILLLALGISVRVAVTAGLGLAQIGEFSFVLARIGLDHNVASRALYGVIVLTAVITLFVTPPLTRLAPHLTSLLGILLSRWRTQQEVEPQILPAKAGHAILCGYGRVGRRITQALVRAHLGFIVIDYDQNAARAARDAGYTAIYGDSSNYEILLASGAASASVAMITIPDAVASSLAIGHLRRMNSSIAIVARAHSVEDAERLRSAGADAVVWPELEAGIEMIRQMASYLGLDADSLARAARNNEEQRNE